jgi:adenosylmethionine-8-amino-7-oxononanoate aminotransferase
VILAGFTHRSVVVLSERLAALAPPGLGHAFYGSDGASATEIALKMAFHYWRNRGRPEKAGFVSLQGSYHGETLGALAVTDVAIFRDTYAPLLKRNATVPAPDARRARPGESDRDVAERAAQALEAHLAAHHGTTAALIVEPLVQGASAWRCRPPLPRTCARLRWRAADSRRNHDGIRAEPDAVLRRQTGSPDFLCLSKGSRCTATVLRAVAGAVMPRSAPHFWGSCTRIRTRATPSRAGLSLRCSISSATTM